MTDDLFLVLTPKINDLFSFTTNTFFLTPIFFPAVIPMGYQCQLGGGGIDVTGGGGGPLLVCVFKRP
jgi:hypothetical protein